MPNDENHKILQNKKRVSKYGPRGPYQKWARPKEPEPEEWPPVSKRKNFENTPRMHAARLRNLVLAREVRRNRPPRIVRRSLSMKQYQKRMALLSNFHYSEDPVWNELVFDLMHSPHRPKGFDIRRLRKMRLPKVT